jgi:hypothetical protein
MFFSFILSVALVASAHAGGMIGKVVSSPLSAVGTTRGARTGINIYLQNKTAPGIEFMNPDVIGYGIPPGGRLVVDLVEGFERDKSRKIDSIGSDRAIILVTGTPQQGLPGAKAGYQITEGKTPNRFIIKPTKAEGLAAEKLMAGAAGAKQDPIRQRGIKVIHVGLKSAFFNRGDAGKVLVRLFDGNGNLIDKGSGKIAFLDKPVPQIHPTNLADGRRNHNWQRISSGETLGHTPGTVPITLMLYAKAESLTSKQGIIGAGVLSTQQLNAMKFTRPAELARYTGGLIVQDTNADGRIDPNDDRIIGGVIGAAPQGAKGQEAKSLVRDGVATLSRPTTAFAAKPGKRFGGAIMQVEFIAGNKPGLYRPTFALLRNPGNLSSGDGSSYTYTIVVK